MRSAILPGWGQLYNGKPYKALLFAGAGVTLFSMAATEQSTLDDARSPQEHEDRIARRNTRILFFALSVTLASIDAYVDAHLARFADRWDVYAGPNGVDLPYTLKYQARRIDMLSSEEIIRFHEEVRGLQIGVNHVRFVQALDAEANLAEDLPYHRATDLK